MEKIKVRKVVTLFLAVCGLQGRYQDIGVCFEAIQMLVRHQALVLFYEMCGRHNSKYDPNDSCPCMMPSTLSLNGTNGYKMTYHYHDYVIVYDKGIPEGV